LRRQAKSLDYFQRSIDLIIVYGSWVLAYFLRFTIEIGGDSNNLGSSFYFSFGFLLVLTSLITFKNSKLYDQMRLEVQSKEIAAQIKANLIAFVAFLIIAFFVSNDRISRVMLVMYFLISTGLLIWSKIYFRKLLSKKPIRLGFVGNGNVSREYYSKLQASGNLEVLFWVDPPSELESKVNVKSELDYYKLERAGLDGLVIGYDNNDSDKASKVLSDLSEFIIPIIILPDVSFAKIGYSISEYKGQPLIYLNEPNIKQFGLILKRIFDFVATVIGVLLISPILIMIAVLVKTTSRGPIFYGQVRMGVDGREFKMWKFRSMVVGDANTEGWTVKNDPRVTRIGRFLRKSNLDELPQLWNIIVGDMSLVGPRPERPQYVEKFREEIPGYMIRHKFKAGLTGWAQVNGWRGDTSIEKRIECDLWYIKNWNFFLDISIIFMTFFKGNKNAY